MEVNLKGKIIAVPELLIKKTQKGLQEQMEGLVGSEELYLPHIISAALWLGPDDNIMDDDVLNWIKDQDELTENDVVSIVTLIALDLTGYALGK